MPLENAVKSRGFRCRGVAQPGSAPALGEEFPLPTALSRFIVFQCFQQLGESAFAQTASPISSTGRVLVQFCYSRNGPLCYTPTHLPMTCRPPRGLSEGVFRESDSSIPLDRTPPPTRAQAPR